MVIYCNASARWVKPEQQLAEEALTVEDGTRLDYSCDMSLSWFHHRISTWMTHRFMAKAYRLQSRKTFENVQGTG